MEEKSLPKPQTDLPLPEKELPAHTQKNNIFKSKVLIGFVLISTLVAFLIGGIMLGKTNTSVRNQTQETIATPSPIANILKNGEISESHENSDWKTFTNNKYGVSIDFPRNWNVATDNYLNSIPDYIIFSIYKDKNNRQGSRIELYKNFQGGFCEGSNLVKETIYLNNIKATKWICNKSTQALIYKIGDDEFALIKVGNENDLFEKMFTSFKIIEPNNEVFCTQDAKLCPDGSYVGRSGPKCEFKACPTQ